MALAPPEFNLAFQLASGQALDVRTFTVQERVGQPFRISLTVVDRDPDLDLEGFAGEAGRFEISTGRAWVGVVHIFELIQAEPTGLSTYRLELAPALWLLTQRTNHRIFQRMTEPEMVTKILGEWRIPFDLRIDAPSYKKREYRVQYAETDFAFVSRILEDTGITYWFETVEGATRLVLSDAPHNAELRPAIRHVARMPSHPDEDLVTRLSAVREVRSGKHTVRDADFRVPPRHPLLASSDPAGKPIEAILERFEYSPGAFLFEGTGTGTPHADDKITVRSIEREGERLAQRRLEADRSEAKAFRFSTNAYDLRPGLRVAVIDHPRSELGPDNPLLITDVDMRGELGSEWWMMCRATRTDVPFRVPLSTPKPAVSGVETATVVGADGDEIHTDEFGRVRVHFHWDRESVMNDESSCWVPVSHAWAGTGYGSINLPRVGQEVVVDFLGGNPDRPVVVGRIYTALQPVPYKLPENKTQSGWKSNSTGGTGGYNEIMFDDRGGEELFRVQAERDMQTLVKHNESRTVERNRNTSIRGNESTSVGGNRSVSTQGNEQTVVAKDSGRHVGQNDSLAVLGDASMIVVGNRLASATADTFSVSDTFEVTVDGPDGPHGTLTMTPGKIVLSTNRGAILTLEENKLHLAADAITLMGQSVIVSAVQSIDLSGADVKANALKTLNLSGGAMTELTSTGPTTIKGTPVMLNGPGLLAARVTDLAVGAVTTGAALVLVGGPSFPFPVVRLDDGTLQVGHHIFIKPGVEDPDFQNKVLKDLGIMSSTATGRGRLINLDVNPGGYDVTILEYGAAQAQKHGPNNSLCGAESADAYRTDDGYGNPVPGPGSSSTVWYNPNSVSGPAVQRRPPDSALHHELGHAEHNAHGVNRAKEPLGNWDNGEEWQTIEGPNGQNQYLEERGYPYHRSDYGHWEDDHGNPIPT